MAVSLHMTVRRVIDSIYEFYVLYKKWINAFEASNVVTVFVRIGTTLVMGIDPANRTKVVPGRIGVELIQRQDLLALQNPQAGQRH